MLKKISSGATLQMVAPQRCLPAASYLEEFCFIASACNPCVRNFVAVYYLPALLFRWEARIEPLNLDRYRQTSCHPPPADLSWSWTGCAVPATINLHTHTYARFSKGENRLQSPFCWYLILSQVQDLQLQQDPHSGLSWIWFRFRFSFSL